MRELTPLAIAVLALLNEQPMHAYEMYQLLLARQNHRLVKVRPGSLYHTVERLAGQEFVRATGTERAGNRPERTTYAITPDGQRALMKRVRTGIEKYEYEYPLFPVVLSEAHNLDSEDALARLRSRVEELDVAVAEFEATIADVRAREVPEQFWMAGDFNRAQMAGEREWLNTLIKRIESKDLAWSHRKNK
ncbi:PadR family transcriptional regulator [Kribbella qitaiheensis]|uniref:PadR family transcriptional regulator n=1 Tax=Kribbella qitaiheensis TaxID=1544730 RepID=A0A7G6WZ68_9ACTN|nr:PadR family transcriptional regulator [Kribbella qitaiheensis]QNE19283.1 PadR family transcriptional regulator [Kribbella qitaiheensis]